jgi:hypothetical protein
VVVIDKLGVLNDAPVPREVPPLEALYQLKVAAAVAFAPKVTKPVPHLSPFKTDVMEVPSTTTAAAVEVLLKQPEDIVTL